MIATHKLQTLAATFVAAGLFAAESKAAALIFETVDTGDTIADAIILGAGIDQVNGTLSSNSDYDLWGFILGQDQILVIDLGNSTFDDNLILFDSAGSGLYGDDDGGSGLDSQISTALTAGLYYVAVGPNNMAGFTPSGVEIIDNDWGFVGGTPQTIGYIGAESGGTHSAAGASYVLSFSVASVPEPSAAILMGMGALGFVARRRRTA